MKQIAPLFRKGFFFSMDAFLAALVLIGGLLILSTITDPQDDTSQIVAISQDTLLALEAIHIYDIEDPKITALIANGTIPDENVTVLEQIGFFWATGDSYNANYLSEIFLNDTHTEFGLKLTFEGQPIYQRPSTLGGKDIIASSRMVTGIAQGEAIKGSSATAHLKRIKDKRTNSFTVFGGFVGQGNITARFLDLPADANITSVTLEAATGAPFIVSFNGVQCGGTYTPPDTNGTPGAWDLSLCNQTLVPGGTNIMGVNFSAGLNESYIVGGFLRVRYKTEELSENISKSFIQYRFPGIRGVVNLFDGFYVPGTLNEMNISLHYNASNYTYLEIGDKRVWSDDGNDTEKTIILNDSYLKDPTKGKLDYLFLSNKTIPLRMAGFSPNATMTLTGDADVIIITDFSGSMKKAVEGWDQGNLGDNCDVDGEETASPGIYDNDDIRRTRLSTCVDKLFVTNVMNYTGNRIWPVFIHSDTIKWYNNPSDESGIKGYIDSYANGKDKTCYACAFNKAHEIFSTFNEPGRQRFIVFMTDGVPTHCASGSCLSTSSTYGVQQCEGLCDTSGACDASDIPGQCTACTTNNGGQTNAYFAANRSVNDFNATIYTVGFGPVTDCDLAGDTLQEIANIGNGTYQHSDNSTELKLIYENISAEIKAKTNLVAQVAITEGFNTRSFLYDDSYINISYTLAQQLQPQQNTIEITLQTDQACNPSLVLYDQQRLIDAKAISYSGVHWTDNVTVNGAQAYNLTTYLKPYAELGDPTLVYTPIEHFSTGANTINIETGDSPTNDTGCSVNNSAIYSVLVNLSTERSIVVPEAGGCTWTVQFIDDTYDTLKIPKGYSGNNTCSYQVGNITYDPTDAYQLGSYQILKVLDFNNGGKLFVNLKEEDLEIVVTTIGGIPYLWGPSQARIEVTR